MLRRRITFTTMIGPRPVSAGGHGMSFRRHLWQPPGARLRRVLDDSCRNYWASGWARTGRRGVRGWAGTDGRGRMDGDGWAGTDGRARASRVARRRRGAGGCHGIRVRRRRRAGTWLSPSRRCSRRWRVRGSARTVASRLAEPRTRQRLEQRRLGDSQVPALLRCRTRMPQHPPAPRLRRATRLACARPSVPAHPSPPIRPRPSVPAHPLTPRLPVRAHPDARIISTTIIENAP